MSLVDQLPSCRALTGIPPSPVFIACRLTSRQVYPRETHTSGLLTGYLPEVNKYEVWLVAFHPRDLEQATAIIATRPHRVQNREVRVRCIVSIKPNSVRIQIKAVLNPYYLLSRGASNFLELLTSLGTLGRTSITVPAFATEGDMPEG